MQDYLSNLLFVFNIKKLYLFETFNQNLKIKNKIKNVVFLSEYYLLVLLFYVS